MNKCTKTFLLFTAAITLGADLTNGGAGGDKFTTYALVPFYMTSQMRALMLRNSGYTAFDLRAGDRVRVEAFGWGLVANLFSGATPAEIIAPVTDEGADTVKVYLPSGEWVHVWIGETYTGGQYVTVAAPLGQPAVFYIKGSAWGEDFTRTLKNEGLMP